MTIRNWLLALGLLGLSAALQAEPVEYGDTMPEGPAASIGEALSDFNAHAGEPRKFTGRITQVCQNKGCWLMLEDGAAVARVMAHDHGFSVPKDSAGMATVYGVLEQKQLDHETAQHLAEDAGENAVALDIEYRIDAYSVVLGG